MVGLRSGWKNWSDQDPFWTSEYSINIRQIDSKVRIGSGVFFEGSIQIRGFLEGRIRVKPSRIRISVYKCIICLSKKIIPLAAIYAYTLGIVKYILHRCANKNSIFLKVVYQIQRSGFFKTISLTLHFNLVLTYVLVIVGF